MKHIFAILLTFLVFTLPCKAQSQFEDFEDDFFAGQCVPDCVYEPLSTGFTCINGV